MCTAAVLITIGSTFLKSAGWQNQSFSGNYHYASSNSCTFVGAKGTKFFMSVQIKNYGYMKTKWVPQLEELITI
jgi:hypothetical protein